MDRKRLAYFQKQLSSWQREVERRLGIAAQGRHDDEGPEPDVADRASRSYEKELSLLSTAQQQQRLRTVQQALRRIGTGEYGQCLSCGNEISAKRLEAVPWTKYCIECQENLEQGSAA